MFLPHLLTTIILLPFCIILTFAAHPPKSDANENAPLVSMDKVNSILPVVILNLKAKANWLPMEYAKLVEIIAVALKADYDIKLAAKIYEPLEHYLEKVKPLIDAHRDRVHYMGEMGDEEKGKLLGNAVAMLFPIEWPEPFGMVMVESMACGTPVVAHNIGSVVEVIENGISGYIFNVPGVEEKIDEDLEEKFVDTAVEALKKAVKLDRARVREEFMERFTVKKMTEGYEKIYYERIELAKTMKGEE